MIRKLSLRDRIWLGLESVKYAMFSSLAPDIDEKLATIDIRQLVDEIVDGPGPIKVPIATIHSLLHELYS